MSDSFQQRGGIWVVVQFVLMGAVILLAPLCRERWGNWLTLAAGAVLFALGAVVGIRGDRVLGKFRTPFPQPVGGSQLITTGIYARIRHPLYASLILLAFGWALVWSSRAVLAVALVQAVFLDLKARREERWLREKFSNYADYARRVKRFFPGLY
ncbi:MAG: isoprenylcysteine carboxylmethyltransferase family protein [Verrucomicrobia bacterium]|nr:isoprenylcysteine carboxylmethyltransferase family protein [Verrucomicrobiota bacterium]